MPGKVEIICRDPFRLFFPVAIFCLLYGSLLWVLFGVFDVGDFPVAEHANIFFGGFLSFSIIGFLLTAIPRFTQTDYLSKTEVFIAFILINFSLIAYFTDQYSLFWLNNTVSWLYLIQFGIKRFSKRQQNPPFTFVFVALGIILGLFGSFFIFLSDHDSVHFGDLENWGKFLIFDGMITSFILGVGGRLIPGILGFVEIVNQQRQSYESTESFFSSIPTDINISLVVFLLSLFFEGYQIASIAYILRALVITYFAFKYWRHHEKVKTQKWHGKMLKLSCYFLLISSWLLCIFTDYTIHIKHLIYIGTYCLMTLMVAGRVIIAHGGESLEIEHKIYPYLVIGTLLSWAAAIRILAIFLPGSYLLYLGLAGSLLLLGTVIWILFFLKRILKD